MKNLSISYEAKRILNKLRENGEQGYLVGGAVRDMLMGTKPSDYDITTSARPQTIEQIFADYPLVTLGKKFGTIGVLVGDELIEVTTFRSDGDYVDGRHPEMVEFSDVIEDDLSRRDFTINAIAMDIDGNIIDLFGGIDDLKSKCVKTVGGPRKRFEEDKLRMLRAIRFANRFQFNIEKKTFISIQEMAISISQVAIERIQKELNQIILSDTPKNGVELLYQSNLLGEIIPEIIPTVGYDQLSPYHDKNLFNHMTCVMNNVDPKLHLRLAALLHDIGKVHTLSLDENGVGHFYGHDLLGSTISEKILRRLSYDNKTIAAVKILIEQHMKVDPNMGKKGLKRLIKRTGEELILDLIEMMIADLHCTQEGRDTSFLLKQKKEIQTIINNHEVIDQRGLKINGNDLINIGYEEGKLVGKVLNELTDLVLEDEGLNDPQILLAIAKDKLVNKL